MFATWYPVGRFFNWFLIELHLPNSHLKRMPRSLKRPPRRRREEEAEERPKRRSGPKEKSETSWITWSSSIRPLTTSCWKRFRHTNWSLQPSCLKGWRWGDPWPARPSKNCIKRDWLNWSSNITPKGSTPGPQRLTMYRPNLRCVQVFGSWNWDPTEIW